MRLDHRAARLASRGGFAPDTAIIILATIALRAVGLGNAHIQMDEEFYLLVGARMLDGAIPFVDIWDRKPVGLFLIYAFAALFGKGVLAYQLLAMAFVIGTCLILYRMARRYADRTTAVLAAIAYVAYLNILEGMGGQSPVFYNLLMSAAAAILMALFARPDRSRPARLLWHGTAAMLLVGLALQIKYSVVGEGLFFGLFLQWMAWRRHGPRLAMLGGLLWAGTALLPTAAAIAWYWGAGFLDAFLYANFESILLRTSDPLDWQIGRLITTIAYFAPPVGLGLAGIRWARRADPARAAPERHFILAWNAAAWATYLVFGSYFFHYALPLAAPAVLLFAWSSGKWPRLRTALVCLAALASLRPAVILPQREIMTADLDRFLLRMSDTRNCPFVSEGPSILYHLGNFCLPTRYAFPHHLNQLRESDALGIDQQRELRRVLSLRPDYLMMRMPFREDYHPASKAILLSTLERDYRPVMWALQRGDWIVLFRLRPGLVPRPNAAPASREPPSP